MQIFKVFPLKEFPYMKIQEVLSGQKVRDIINLENEDKVFLLVDHEQNRIWTYNGKKSPFKQQIYGGILADLLRRQLRLFYRIYSLNTYSRENELFQEILEKQLAPGKAREIVKEDFPDYSRKNIYNTNLSVHPGLNANKAMEYLESLPKLKKFKLKFVIVGSNIYTEEKSLEKFISDDKISTTNKNIGQLNNGFNFFGDKNYSTRLVIKDRKVQGIELYLDSEEKRSPLRLEIPVFTDNKFTQQGNMEDIIKAFKIPDKNLEE